MVMKRMVGNLRGADSTSGSTIRFSPNKRPSLEGGEPFSRNDFRELTASRANRNRLWSLVFFCSVFANRRSAQAKNRHPLFRTLRQERTRSGCEGARDAVGGNDQIAATTAISTLYSGATSFA